MFADSTKRARKIKVIKAPPPSDPDIFTSIYSITLYENQEVEW